jgi:hypothetical protein
MRTKAKRLSTSIALILFVCMFATFSYPRPASASYASICGGFTRFGRAGCHGYFTNTNFYTTFVVGQNVLNCQLSARGCINVNGGTESPNNALPSSINTATLFENEIGYYLNTGYSYNHAGAAFIIDAMLGRPGSSFGNVTAGINYAVANFNNWKTNYVDYYASKGWITWNQTVTLPAGEINSMHNCSINYNCSQSDIASHDGKDLTFFRNPGSEFSHLIVFHNPGGSTFEIRRECANLVGSLTALTKKPAIVLHPACGGVNVDPGMPDPKTVYTISNATIDYNSSAEVTEAKTEGAKFFIDVTGPSVNYNNGNVATSTTGGGKDLTGANVTPGASNDTGQYTVKYGISGTSKPITCTSQFVIADQPYITTTGGDVSSGAGMNNGGVDCATPYDPNGGLVGWNKGASGGYAGAGTKYAALALNHLQDFATAQGSGLSPTGLAFANTVDGGINVGNGLFGGQFGGLSCAPDYFANATGVQFGNVTLGGKAVANGTHATVYVKGNVYITGNITYSGNYANIGEIPSYSVIVEGNIYIDPGVSQLDGLYVAEPNVVGGVAKDGVIYTCAATPWRTASTAPTDAQTYLTSSLYNTCKGNSLAVNGSFVARQVWLLRTKGTLSGAPAESFNFDPELWLTTPPATSTGGSTVGTKYDAITSLPPVL